MGKGSFGLRSPRDPPLLLLFFCFFFSPIPSSPISSPVLANLPGYWILVAENPSSDLARHLFFLFRHQDLRSSDNESVLGHKRFFGKQEVLGIGHCWGIYPGAFVAVFEVFHGSSFHAWKQQLLVSFLHLAQMVMICCCCCSEEEEEEEEDMLFWLVWKSCVNWFIGHMVCFSSDVSCGIAS